MANYTLNNHLRYSIGNTEYGYRTSNIEPFKVIIGRIDKDQYRLGDYCSELRRTADIVYKEFGRDLVVFLSGGTDSEMVVRTFAEIGVKPKCIAVRFAGGYNDGDILEAIEIAKELDLKLEIIDFDIKDFYFSGEAVNFGKELQCTQLAYLMTYHNIKKIGAPAVMGGEVLLTRYVSMNADSSWYYTFRENEDASAMRFSQKYNIPLVNEWFSYTPELLLHYLEIPEIQTLVAERYNYKLSSVSSKNVILRKLMPEIRPKIKTNGFEKLLTFNFEAYRTLSSMQINRLEPSLDGIEIKEAMRLLRNE